MDIFHTNLLNQQMLFKKSIKKIVLNVLFVVYMNEMFHYAPVWIYVLFFFFFCFLQIHFISTIWTLIAFYFSQYFYIWIFCPTMVPSNALLIVYPRRKHHVLVEPRALKLILKTFMFRSIFIINTSCWRFMDIC